MKVEGNGRREEKRKEEKRKEEKRREEKRRDEKRQEIIPHDRLRYADQVQIYRR